MDIRLLIIDGQNDFIVDNAPLQVGGALGDVARLSKMIATHHGKINKITATMDSHHTNDIGHRWVWLDKSGNHPNPAPGLGFTSQDLISGNLNYIIPSMQPKMIKYCQELEAKNRYCLMVWAEHCVIGTKGAALHEDLFASIQEWERKQWKFLRCLTKGTNPFTEHYSALQAEVPMANDEATKLNIPFINECKDCDMLLIAGWASSHCLAYTVRDLVDNFGIASLDKLVLLEDATSPVGSFEKNADDFFEDMRKRGLTISTTDKIFA